MRFRPIALALLTGASTVISAQYQTIPDFSRIPERSDSQIAYQKYDAAPLRFSTSSQYVLVPVIVTDHGDKPVSGLKQEAFHVFESGRERRITSLEELSQAATEQATPAPGVPGRTGVFTNQVPTSATRLVVIAFDMINTPYLEQARARRQLVSFLSDNVVSDTSYELVAIEAGGVRVLYDFTRDTMQLAQVLSRVHSRIVAQDKTDQAALSYGSVRFNPRPSATAPLVGHPSSTDPGRQIDVAISPDEAIDAMLGFVERPVSQRARADAASSTLRAFEQIANRVSGVPGRKSLIWITGGFPFSIDPSSASVSSDVAFAAYQRVMQVLNNQLVSVYPVDVRGLLTLDPEASNRMRKQAAIMNAQLGDESTRQRDVLDTMRAFADMTGGRAFVNTNDTRGAIQAAARDGDDYYLLSYPVDKSNAKPGWRKITVKVSGGYHVRAREGYYMTQATLDPASWAKSDVETALRSPFDYTGLPLRLKLGAVAAPAKSAEKSSVPFGLAMPPYAATVENNHINVDIAYVINRTDGEQGEPKLVSYNMDLTPPQLQQLQKQGVGYTGNVLLPLGSYRMRVVVRDNLTGKMGSVSAPIEVK